MLRLNDFLPYLVNRIGPAVEAGFAAPLKEAGVDLQSWRVLAVLHEYGEQTVGDLSQLTSVNLSTLSRLIDRMARRGLVRRRRAEGGDGRSVIVVPTESGTAIAEALIPRALDYETWIARGLTAAELRSLKSLLIKLYDGLEAEGTATQLAG